MSGLKQKLLQQGYAFEFFQAVRLLEALHPQGPPVGGPGPFSKEGIQLRPSRSLAFPAGDLQRIEQYREGDREVWRITQNFMGLYGVNSPLPPHIPEMIAQAYQDPDPLRDLLDLFNHRLVSLYYRAWKKNHPAASMDPAAPDRLTVALCALIGQEPGSPEQDWTVAPQRLVRYAGLLMGRNRPIGGLEAIISDYFGIQSVKVHPFLQRRVRLHPWETSRLGAPGRNNRLGRSLVLGEWVDDRAGQFRLSLGPLPLDIFQKLQPGQAAFNELVFLVDFYTRHQLDFQLELILDRENVKPLVLSAREKSNPLGRYSWLGRPPRRSASVYIDATQTE